MSDEAVKFEDFAGGTVIHISWPATLAFVTAISLLVWYSKRKR